MRGVYLTGLRAYARPVNGDRVTAFAQTAQQCFGERGVSEEVLPCRIR
jgi:hypothetical protein